MLVKAIAKLRYVSIPPRKMRLVADMVTGQPVEKALGVLNFTPKIAAFHLAKTLKSAVANALSVQGTDHLQAEDLVVRKIQVDAAPTAKRIRFQSMGRVFRIRKRYCHLLIEVGADVDLEERNKAAVRTRSKKAVAEGDEVAAPTAKKKAAKKSTVKKTVAKKKPAAKKPVAKKTAAKKTAAKSKKEE